MATEPTDGGPFRIAAVVGGAVVLAWLLTMLLAMATMGMGMMGWHWGTGGGGGAGGMAPAWGVGMVLVWTVVLLGIGYLLYRAITGALGAPAGRDPALAELRRAYARGDLTDEEFERRYDRLSREG